MRILKENFETALQLAIEYEEKMGNGEICFTEGLREILAASESGERITIAKN